MNNNAPRSLEQLRAWSQEVQEEIAQIRAEIAPLQQRLNAACERQDLIERLIRLTEGSAAPLTTAEVESGPNRVATVIPVPQEVEGHIENILREVNGPMHISDIRRALVDRAVPLPGRGDEANIIVRLRRAPDRFVRTGRGTYALASSGLEPVPPTKRRRRMRRRSS